MAQVTKEELIQQLVTEAQVYETDGTDIFVSDRQRKEFDDKALGELKESIRELGQIQPGLCWTNREGQKQLVVGERRLRACKSLKTPFHYQMISSETDSYKIALIELSENLFRKDLTWREEADAKAKLHRIFQELYGETRPGARGGHSIADTASYLGKAKGSTAEDIRLSEWASEIPEVASAKNRAEALKTVKRLKESAGRQIALDTARKKVVSAPGNSEVVQVSTDDICTMEEFEARLTYFDCRCLGGTFPETCPEGPFDLVFFDPPWGVELDKVSEASGSKVDYADSKEVFHAMFSEWVKKLYSVMSEDSHLYVFFGIVHHEFVYAILEDAGFETNRMPLVWYKKGTHRTRNPKRWPGRSYEPIAFAHKGHKPLYKQGAEDVITTKPPTPKMKASHKSAKHPEIYRELLERSAKPGDKVLDPMAGSGMCAVACEHLKETLALEWTLVEELQEFRELSVFNLSNVGQILGSES